MPCQTIGVCMDLARPELVSPSPFPAIRAMLEANDRGDLAMADSIAVGRMPNGTESGAASVFVALEVNGVPVVAEVTLRALVAAVAVLDAAERKAAAEKAGSL